MSRHATSPSAPDVVRKVIRHAYARAGLPYTRSHLLRHTMASRLLEGGSSLKEVADVLRHRSLNTTLIYAKLDSTRAGGGRAAVAGSRSMSAPLVANARRALSRRAPPPGLRTAQHELWRLASFARYVAPSGTEDR